MTDVDIGEVIFLTIFFGASLIAFVWALTKEERSK